MFGHYISMYDVDFNPSYEERDGGHYIEVDMGENVIVDYFEMTESPSGGRFPISKSESYSKSYRC